MEKSELLERLETDLEWAEAAGEWEVPLCLADDLRECIKILKRKTAADIYTETEAGRNVLDMIGDWCEAYADERLMVLPCKVGDKVYFRTYAPSGKYLGILPHKVKEFAAYAIVKGKYGVTTNLPIQFFGKSIFLTQEEADDVLIRLKKPTQPPIEWVKEN